MNYINLLFLIKNSFYLFFLGILVINFSEKIYKYY